MKLHSLQYISYKTKKPPSLYEHISHCWKCFHLL